MHTIFFIFTIIPWWIITVNFFKVTSVFENKNEHHMLCTQPFSSSALYRGGSCKQLNHFTVDCLHSPKLTCGVVLLADGTRVSLLVVGSLMFHQVALVDGAKVAVLALVVLACVLPHVGVQVTCTAEKPMECNMV